jgi:hypothetical protein
MEFRKDMFLSILYAAISQETLGATTLLFFIKKPLIKGGRFIKGYLTLQHFLTRYR